MSTRRAVCLTRAPSARRRSDMASVAGVLLQSAWRRQADVSVVSGACDDRRHNRAAPTISSTRYMWATHNVLIYEISGLYLSASGVRTCCVSAGCM